MIGGFGLKARLCGPLVGAHGVARRGRGRDRRRPANPTHLRNYSPGSPLSLSPALGEGEGDGVRVRARPAVYAAGPSNQSFISVILPLFTWYSFTLLVPPWSVADMVMPLERPCALKSLNDSSPFFIVSPVILSPAFFAASKIMSACITPRR